MAPPGPSVDSRLRSARSSKPKHQNCDLTARKQRFLNARSQLTTTERSGGQFGSKRGMMLANLCQHIFRCGQPGLLAGLNRLGWRVWIGITGPFRPDYAMSAARQEKDRQSSVSTNHGFRRLV